MRQYREGHAAGTDGAAVNPGNTVAHRAVVGQVAGLEVVQAVDDYVRAGREPLDVGMVDVVDYGGDGDLGVDFAQPAPRRFGLGQSLRGIPFVEQDLPLQIRDFNEVTVDDDQAPDAGAGQCIGDAAEQDCGGFKQRPLGRFAETGQEHLPVVASQVGHGFGAWVVGHGRSMGGQQIPSLPLFL